MRIAPCPLFALFLPACEPSKPAPPTGGSPPGSSTPEPSTGPSATDTASTVGNSGADDTAAQADCDGFRVSFEARRDSAFLGAVIIVRLRTPEGDTDVGRIDYPTGDFLPYEFDLPADAVLLDDVFLDISTTNVHLQALAVRHTSREFAHDPSVVTWDGAHRYRLPVPTECRLDAELPTDTPTPVDVEIGRSLRLAPPSGQSAHAWAYITSCTVDGVPYRDGTVLLDFLPDGGSLDLGARGAWRLERNPYDVSQVLEDVVLAGEPGTLFLTSSEPDPFSPFRYDCTVQLNTQYR